MNRFLSLLAILSFGFLSIVLCKSKYVEEYPGEAEHWTENPMRSWPKPSRSLSAADLGAGDVRCIILNDHFLEEHQKETKRCCDKFKLKCTHANTGSDSSPWYEDFRCHAKTPEQVTKIQNCCNEIAKKNKTMKILSEKEAKTRFDC